MVQLNLSRNRHRIAWIASLLVLAILSGIAIGLRDPVQRIETTEMDSLPEHEEGSNPNSKFNTDPRPRFNPTSPSKMDASGRVAVFAPHGKSERELAMVELRFLRIEEDATRLPIALKQIRIERADMRWGATYDLMLGYPEGPRASGLRIAVSEEGSEGRQLLANTEYVATEGYPFKVVATAIGTTTRVPVIVEAPSATRPKSRRLFVTFGSDTNLRPGAWIRYARPGLERGRRVRTTPVQGKTTAMEVWELGGELAIAENEFNCLYYVHRVIGENLRIPQQAEFRLDQTSVVEECTLTVRDDDIPDNASGGAVHFYAHSDSGLPVFSVASRSNSSRMIGRVIKGLWWPEIEFADSDGSTIGRVPMRQVRIDEATRELELSALE